MKAKWRVIGLLTALVLVFALVPAVAMAAPAITQGIQGVVKDAATGVPVPFAMIQLGYSGGGGIEFITAEYDGTYSYQLDPDDYYVEAWSPRHMSDLADPVSVTAGAVTTQDFSLVQDPDTPVQPVYRFFNMKGGVHFYTASDEEFINVYKNLSEVFHYDGVAYEVPVGAGENPDWTNPNTMPLYRFFNKKTGVHFYTMSEAEKASVIANRSDDYTFEGVAYYVSEEDLSFLGFAAKGGGEGVTVYRFYVPRRDAHFYTADSGEIFGPTSGLSNYYHYEGIAFYVNYWVYNPD